MTLITSTKERDERSTFYHLEDNRVDLVLMMTDFVSYAKEFGKSYEAAQRLLKNIWEGYEEGTTQ